MRIHVRSHAAVAIAAFAVVLSPAALAGFGTSAPAVSLSQMVRNVVASMVGGISLFDGFLYVVGIACIVHSILLARRHYAKDKQGGGRSMDKDNPYFVLQYIAIFIIGVLSIAAPTLLGSASLTLFGNSAAHVRAPSEVPPGFR